MTGHSRVDAEKSLCFTHVKRLLAAKVLLDTFTNDLLTPY